jgi:hypothetical protein
MEKVVAAFGKVTMPSNTKQQLNVTVFYSD